MRYHKTTCPDPLLTLAPLVQIVSLLWSVLQARHSLFKPYTTLGFVVDFLLNVGALLLSVTLYSSAPLLLSLLLLTAAVFVYILPPNRGRRRPKLPPNATPSKTPSAASASSTTSAFP